MNTTTNTVSITEAGELLNISRQAVHAAIKAGRLNSSRDWRGRHHIKYEDLDEYTKSRWDRHETTIVNGEKLFGDNSDNIMPEDAAQIIGKPAMHIYYAMSHGLLPKKRVGMLCVLSKKDVLAYKEKIAQNKPVQMELAI